MIIRDATSSDLAAVEAFDLGAGRSPWLDEVSEILGGLSAWRADPAQRELDRRVIVVELNNEIVGVAAHERLEDERLGPLAGHRYLMVVAVRADCQRSGVARVVTESIFANMQRSGVHTVQWLVAPGIDSSLTFSRRVFPEADESYPPEDRRTPDSFSASDHPSPTKGRSSGC